MEWSKKLLDLKISFFLVYSKFVLISKFYYILNAYVEPGSGGTPL